MNFEQELKKLNKAQRLAVETIEGPVMVVAGPGTGKTQVLTLRIASILKKTDTPAESVLALTFTESAVAAMRERLVEIMGPEAYRVSIKTIHGFCNEVIQEHPEDFPAIAGATNITEVQQIDIVRRLLDKGEYDLLRPFGEPYRNIRDILGAIGDLKQEGVLPEAFLQLVKDEQKEFDLISDLYNEKGAHAGKMKGKYQTLKKRIEKHAELAELYAAYQKELRKRKSYDYDDMVVEVAAALSINESLLLTLQEKYLYVLVDEHQDTNASQNRVIELLASYDKSPNLFVVGDEKQAIYRFQGASVENFTYFQKKFKGTRLIALTENYRSHQTILDAALDIALGKGQLHANAKHAKKPIQLFEFSHPDVEVFFVASDIKRKIGGGAAPEDIAVFYRENKDAAPVARMLEKLGVPFSVQSDEDTLEDADIKKLLVLLEAVRDFGRDHALVPTLYIDFLGIAPLDIALLLEAARQGRSSVFSLVRDPKTVERIIPESGRAVFELYRKLSLWKAMSRNRNLVEVFETIVRESGLLSHLLALPNTQEKLAKVHALFDELKGLLQSRYGAGLEDFLDHLQIIREHRLRIKSSFVSAQKSAVRLMTAHKAKGLEFDSVYIVGATLGHWGGRRNRDSMKLPASVYLKNKGSSLGAGDLSDDADERNLFYVALTRAKKEACISYANKNADGKDQLPSEFVAAIRPGLIKKASVQKFEEEFASRGDIEFAKGPETGKEGLDKEYRAFLKKRFGERGLSVSGLNAYLRCPNEFLLVYLVGIPEAPTKFLQYGNAVHAALKYLNDRKNPWAKSGQAVGAAKAQVLKVFTNALSREPISERDLSDLLKKGTAALGAYYDANYKKWPAGALAELAVYGVQVGDVELRGKIDRVDISEVGAVRVVDYKTGKTRTRNEILGLTKDADGGYYRQLVFYKLLLEKAALPRLGKNVKVKEAELDFVEGLKREVFAPSEKEVKELEAEIKRVAGEIFRAEFEGCKESDCKYCALTGEV